MSSVRLGMMTMVFSAISSRRISLNFSENRFCNWSNTVSSPGSLTLLFVDEFRVVAIKRIPGLILIKCKDPKENLLVTTFGQPFIIDYFLFIVRRPYGRRSVRQFLIGELIRIHKIFS